MSAVPPGLEEFLTRWFERHLTAEEIANVTDDEMAATLVSDLYAADFRVHFAGPPVHGGLSRALLEPRDDAPEWTI